MHTPTDSPPNKKRFLELPELPIREMRSLAFSVKTNFQNSIPAEYHLQLGSQCIDHAVVIVVAAIFVGAGLSLFNLSNHQAPLIANPFVWLSITGLVFWIGFVYRSLAFGLFGESVGSHLNRIQPAAAPGSPRFFIEIFLESLHLALPVLWILDIVFRSQFHFALGMRMTYRLRRSTSHAHAQP